MSSEEGSAAVGAADVGGRMKELVLSNDQSVSQSVFTIRVERAFTFKTILRNYVKLALTPR